jgi:hypothetical protein
VELPDAFSGAQELNSEYWINPTTGWISGYNVLLYTSNGGQNFTNLFANVPPTGNGFNDLLSIWFVNQQTGWLGGSNLDKKNIYKTTDAGSTWIFQTNPVSQNNAYVQINDLGFMTQDSGWAIHGTPFSGAIMFTTNGGANWLTEEGSNNWFQSISIYDRSKAWCAASSGRVWYSDLTQPLGISGNSNNLSSKYSLSQNYPNPFNPVTTISYCLPGNSIVNLAIYDNLGRKIAELINGEQLKGNHEAVWDASKYSSGIYFYELSATQRAESTGNGGNYRETKKMILVK